MLRELRLSWPARVIYGGDSFHATKKQGYMPSSYPAAHIPQLTSRSPQLTSRSSHFAVRSLILSNIVGGAENVMALAV